MRGYRNYIKRFLAMVGIIVLSFAVSPNLPEYPVQAAGNCSEEDSIKIESSPFTATAPEGLIISKVFIKAGSDSSGGGCFEFTSDGNNGCYQVEGIGTSTVVATRIGEGSDCKEISHAEFISTEPSDSPVPTPTPPEPTPTPPEITPTPTPPSENPTPTPTPESTPTPTPTSPPIGGSNSSTNGNDPGQPTEEAVLGASDISEEEKEGEVLGASALAETNGNPLSLGTIFQLSGLLLSGFGAIYHTKIRDRVFTG